MVTLELGVDARGVTQGLREADRALDQTSRKAQTTEGAVKRMGTAATQSGNNLSAAFAATGGGLSVTRGLVSIGDGLRSANLGMATFAASQALLDVGRLSADMKAVGDATGGVGGTFGKLGAIIKANPLLTIATVLAGAATAMGLFGSETNEAAKAFERIAKAQRDARLSEVVKGKLGISTTPARQSQLSSLEELVQSLEGSAGQRSLGGLASETGATLDQIRRAQGLVGGITEMNPTRMISVINRNQSSRMGAGSSLQSIPIPLSEQQVSADVAQRIVIQVYKDLRKEVDKQVGSEKGVTGGSTNGSQSPAPFRSYYPGNRTPQLIENDRISKYFREQRQKSAYQFGSGGQFEVNFDGGPSTAGDLIRQTPGERAQIDAANAARDEDLRNQSIERAQVAMDNLVQSGREFGATIGDAFFNVASGAQSARQAIASIVADLARSGLRQAFAGIGGAVAGGFGATATQSAANATPGSNLTLPEA